MASRIHLAAPVTVSDTQIHFWLTAVRAATALILDSQPIAGDTPRTKHEELVVAVVHQLAMAEQSMQEVLGQDIGYVVASGELI